MTPVPPSVPPRVPSALAALALALAGVSGCSRQEEPRADPAATIQLLARGPDAIFEQPGTIAPHEDLPGTATWGASEGPGWSETLHEREDGTPYRITNQPVARLRLGALEPAERELVLVVWCADAASERPGTLAVRLNGVDLVPALELSATPRVERIAAPGAAWAFGENELELAVPQTGEALWDAIGLARVEYGPEVRVRTDPAARTATLPPGCGLSYCVTLSGSAELLLHGHAGPGALEIRTGALDAASGERHLDPVALRVVVEDGSLDGRLALGGRAGETRVLELVWSGKGSSATLEQLDVVEPASLPRPPIVFVSIDTLAARHMSVYGYERATTPALEALAQDAVLFEHCVANAPWTLPSYLSVLTGLYPRAHHVAQREGELVHLDNSDWWQVAPNRWTVAEALRARGYQTGAFVDTYWLSPQWRTDQGFDVYDGRAALLSFHEPEGGIRYLVDELAREWLDARSSDVPFFLFLHALDAHGPYWPEAPFRDAFSADLPEPGTSARAGSDNQTFGAIPAWMAMTAVPEEPFPPELQVEPIVARYDETILKVDHFLGRLVDGLRARGLYDEAVIVISADHGESFDHGVYGHGVVWEDVLHVPLIVKLPGNEAGGTRVAETVQLVDVAPTLYELAGAGLPANLHGRSLLPLARGQRSQRPAFSEGGHVEQYAVHDGSWKLVEVFPGRESGDVSLLTHPRVPRAWLEQNFPELVERPLSDALREELGAQAGYAAKIAELRALVPGPY